jgi:glutamate formiminotransferase/formiminotetrahydrofolate cyclodeaminase
MVAKLTHGVRRFESVQAEMEKVIPALHHTVRELIPMIDADTSAFQEYMEGLRMPKDTAEERSLRKAKMQAGLKTATKVPLTTMRLGDSVWPQLLKVARYGNPASKSDTQVGARSLETGIWGAYQNVLINMVDIDDDAFRSEILDEASAIMGRAEDNCREVLNILEEH